MLDEHPILPLVREQLPTTLLIGEFTLEVETYVREGHWDAAEKQFTGVAGAAWMGFDLPPLPWLPSDPGARPDIPRLLHSFEVVARVANPQTEISLPAAQRIQPGIQIGQTLTLETALKPDELQELISAGEGVLNWLGAGKVKGQVLVGFGDVTIKRTGKPAIGRIVQGQALYPITPRIPKLLEVTLEGFTLRIDALTLTPRGSTADVTLQLPASLAEKGTCQRATLALGTVAITHAREIFVQAPQETFGPWIVGDSGMVIQGHGFTFDLSPSQSPPGMPAGWRGLLLHAGQATGFDLTPEPANTAYLRGKYSFSGATVTATGLDAHLVLSEAHTFSALNPLHYRLTLDAGWLQVQDSRVVGGEFGPGRILLPQLAVCQDSPGSRISVGFSRLVVQTDLDLASQVECGGGIRLTWGELTHAGDEVLAWQVEAGQGFLYLPANPRPSFSPDTGSAFRDLSLVAAPDASLNELEAQGATGLAVRELRNLTIFSPDLPGGRTNPLRLGSLDGWLRVGSQGVDGKLLSVSPPGSVQLGEPARPGYVGGKPFSAWLLDKLIRIAQYAASAVYDANVNGTLKIPEPCKVDALDFQDMELTSTAHLVGGNVILPPDGVKLDYWQLQLVPTGDPNQAGVVSVRTGRIVFAAAGISELVHFARPFPLTWGEVLADGNLGELYLDYNNYGQRFDGLPYNPQHLLLSEYVAGATDIYLATCGTLHLNFFGSHFINIHDARYHVADLPCRGRYVTTPKSGEGTCAATDLHLAATWNAQTSKPLAVFDFPDAQMDYDVAAQDGFIGSGKGDISFFRSDGLPAQIEVHREAIDVRLSSEEAHDIDLGLWARLGGMREIYGCARIEGPLLSRIAFYGMLEACSASGMGILAPKAGCMVEITAITTPNALDFAAAGDMLLQVAASAVDLSASVHLLFDYARGTAEGELIGRMDCNTILGGLEGEGQVTWHVGPDMQYLQGRTRVCLCGWMGSGGMEGGFFIGHRVPKARAWVLHTGSEHFGVSDAILPEYLTGLFGYGMLSTSINLYLFGGGVELYAGMGAFSEAPPGLSGAWGDNWSDIPGLGLPYVLGSGGVYVHGEILGGVVSASAWADLDLRGPVPIYFDGSFGLEGCVAWVICASVTVTAGLNSDGFYLY